MTVVWRRGAKGVSVAVRRVFRLLVASLLLMGALVGASGSVASAPAAGSLDPSFGEGGKVVTDFAGSDDTAYAVAIQGDGKIVAAGLANTAAGTIFGVTRYLPDGTLDAGFGTGGKVTTDFGRYAEARAIGIQGDGKIVVAGFVRRTACCGYDFGVARYAADGTPDAGFGTGGKLLTDFQGGNGYANDAALQGDGKIVVAGQQYLVRYESDGTLDTSFGTNGIVDVSGDSWAITGVALHGGKIIASGYTLPTGSTRFAIARFDADGSYDTTFGTDGVARAEFTGVSAVASGVATAPDGKIIAAGWAGSGFGVARFTASGNLDSSFGSDGTVITPPASNSATAWAEDVALQADGKIVVAGCSTATWESTVARYTTDGSLDSAFGSSGIATTDFGDSCARDVAIQADGKIVVAGEAWLGASTEFGVARFLGEDGASAALTLTDPGPQTSVEGESVSLLLDASGPSGGSLTFSALNLPPGLSLDAATGQISGSSPASAVGTYWVTATVSDGSSQASVTFRWDVRGAVKTGLWQWGNLSGATNKTPAFVGAFPAVSVAAGLFHSLALTADGRVLSWGSNTYGQLGRTTGQTMTPTEVSGLSGIVAVAAGEYHSLALDAAGLVFAWGSNDRDQLGRSDVSQSTTPVLVDGLTRIVAIAAGRKHNLALDADGRVFAWGDNGSGQLGDNSNVQRTVPVPLTSLSDIAIAAVAAGNYHSVALTADGRVFTWGANWYGQLGNGTTSERRTPGELSSLSQVVSVAGGGFHTLAVRADGGVLSWGHNQEGQLGRTTGPTTSPGLVGGLSGIVAVASGATSSHNLGLRSNGQVYAWGRNSQGQLGDGTTIQRLTPVLVRGLSGALALAAAGYHSVAVGAGAVVPATESVTMDVAGGGTVTTDFDGTGVTAENPITTAVTTPNAGRVGIVETSATSATSGYVLLGQRITITAPEATVLAPLVISFRLHSSVLPSGLQVASLLVTRNGAQVQPCSGAAGTASPDPCVAAAEQLADGEVLITIHTSRASDWELLLPQQAFKSPQSIAFDAPASATFETSFNVHPVASSNLPVSLSGSGACSVAAAGAPGAYVVIMTGATGNCVLTASQPGDDLFNAAPSVQRTVAAAPWHAVGFHQPIGHSSSLVVPAPGTAPAAGSGTVWNTAKGGSTVPLRFNLYTAPGGAERTSVGDISSFQAVKLANCVAAPEDPIDEFASTGQTSLRYDTASGHFIQNWATPKVTKDECYRVGVRFRDTSAIYAFVKVRK
jgi:uncharacterized delta-60 repeat protein